MWDFKGKWEQEVSTYENLIVEQFALYNSIKNSECIHMLLGTILAIGNVLNDGTKNGQADGFDMDVVKLSKPSAIKDCNGKSLLDYACKQIMQNHKTFPAEIR